MSQALKVGLFLTLDNSNCVLIPIYSPLLEKFQRPNLERVLGKKRKKKLVNR